jgi:hypothetical protein
MGRRPLVGRSNCFSNQIFRCFGPTHDLGMVGKRDAALVFVKCLRVDPGLAENGAQRAFRQIARMVGDGGIAARGGINSDFL